MKDRKAKGFTLAELLIVVAIIAILAAVAIPIFTVNNEKTRRVVEKANARSTYGEAVVAHLQDDSRISLSRIYDGIQYTAALQVDDTWTVRLINAGKAPLTQKGFVIDENGTFREVS